MTQNVVQNSLSARNTKKKGANKERHRNWFLTFNNWDQQGLDKIVGQNNIVFYRIQEEIGENGTPHLQGVIGYKVPRTFSKMKLIDNRIHWEVCKNIYAAINYCKKGLTSTGKNWSMGIDDIMKKKGKITVLSPLEGKKLYPWQEDIECMLATPADDRSIYWIWENTGNTGKTAFIKHYCINTENCLVVGGSCKDAYHLLNKMVNDEGKEPNVIFWNLCRSDYDILSYKAVEGIKDGIFCSPKYDSTMVMFNPCHVVIFCNLPPKLDKLSKDRWKIYKIDEVSKSLRE